MAEIKKKVMKNNFYQRQEVEHVTRFLNVDSLLRARCLNIYLHATRRMRNF